MNKIDESELQFMELAIELAKAAAEKGEAPVGAVAVLDGKVVGRGHNMVESWNDPTAHAEIVALRLACRSQGHYRLPGASIYVTLEPCIMCAAALVHARVARVVYGAHDYRWGGFGTLFDFSHDQRLNHEIEVISEVMRKECSEALQGFFRQLRKPAKQ